jgi:Icc-related predicted phosphoesterase
MSIKIAFISDTHSFHTQWEMKMIERGYINELEQCDIIAFCGDMTARGSKYDVQNFLTWFDNLGSAATQKVFIAGNHDFFFENKFQPQTDKGNQRFGGLGSTDMVIDAVLAEFPNIHYLNDSGAEIMGLKFWGSPVSPFFHDWAFNRFRSNGENGVPNGIKEHWDIIPNDIDVMLVHGPPRGKLDLLHPKFRRFNEDPHVGDDDLLDAMENRVKPKVCAFGHIHEGYGVWEPQMSMKEFYTLEEKVTKAEAKLEEMIYTLKSRTDKPSTGWTKANKAKGNAKANVEKLKLEMERLDNLQTSEITYVNASCLDEDYKPTNPPIFVKVTGKDWK